MSSWLVQVSWVPAFTVITPGAKAKLSILTSSAEPVSVSPAADRAIGGAPKGSEVEAADAPLSIIADTTASAKTQHLKSINLPTMFFTIIHLSSKFFDLLSLSNTIVPCHVLSGTLSGSRCRTIEGRIDNRKTLAADHVIHIGNSQHSS